MGILIAVLLFVIGALYNIFFGSYLQMQYGLHGLAVTEVGFALMAFGAGALALHARRGKSSAPLFSAENAGGEDIRDVFSFRLPKARHVLGGLLLAGGGFLVMNLMSAISARLFPQVYIETAEGISYFLRGGTMTLLCGMAFIPAVCEELLFRGAMQYSLSRSVRPMAAVIWTGVLFGMFHLDPLRSPILTVGGILFSYAAYRSRSILVPMLMHFAHNAVSVLASGADTGIEGAAEQLSALSVAGQPALVQVAYVAGVLVAGAAAASMLTGGVLFLEKDPIGIFKRHRVAVSVFIALFVLVLLAAVITGLFPVVL